MGEYRLCLRCLLILLTGWQRVFWVAIQLTGVCSPWLQWLRVDDEVVKRPIRLRSDSESRWQLIRYIFLRALVWVRCSSSAARKRNFSFASSVSKWVSSVWTPVRHVTGHFGGEFYPWLCTNVVYSTSLNSSDNVPSHATDSSHNSGFIRWRVQDPIWI